MGDCPSWLVVPWKEGEECFLDAYGVTWLAGSINLLLYAFLVLYGLLWVRYTFTEPTQ